MNAGIALPALGGLLLALGACVTPAAKPEAAAEPPLRSGCDASKAQFAIGHQPGMALQDQVREKSGAPVVRTVRPGQAITMEYNADRLTLSLDASGKVVRVSCG
jgi:hypothetical protein